MSNSRPPGFRAPGKNTPPNSPGFPGGHRPPIERGLNKWNGLTWAEMSRPPSSPFRSLPPKTNPFSKTPPKPPGFNSPINPPGFKFGLGSVAGALGVNLALELLFPAPAADATLPPWWQPPRSPADPSNPTNTYSLDPAKVYIVTISASITNGYGGILTSSGPETFQVSGGARIFPPEFERRGQQQGYSFLVVYPSGFGMTTMMGLAVISPERWSGISYSFSVRERNNTTPINPTPPPPPAPPYALPGINLGNSPLTAPTPGINLGNSPLTAPTPGIGPNRPNPNPSPFPSPSGNPLISPSDPIPKNPSDPDENNPPYPFPPFTPFPLNPTEKPLTRKYVKDDPVLSARSPKTNPFPNLNPTPLPDFNLTPNPTPNRNPNSNRNPNPTPFPPGFVPFGPLNPEDPVITPKEEKKSPVIQTPPGSNCCVPTPVTNSLGDINQKSDLLLEKMIDLSLLQVINGKLGPQVNGGLSGFLQDRFTKLWKSRVVDRALNLMATAAAIHNAVMLSRNIGSTLIQTLGNALNIIGIKDGDEVAQNFSTVIGDGIENIIKGLIGAENYTTLSETWSKANRIYQSAINIYQLMTDSLFGITEGLEQIGKYTGKIGNALKKSGTVLENSYNWMTETFNFSSGKNRKIDRVIQGLQQASEVASDLESITSEFRSVTENVAEIGPQINTIKTEINGKEIEKETEQNESKEASQSPGINKSDLVKPDTE